MKPSAIKAGMFVRRAKNGFVREILYVGGPGAETLANGIMVVE